MEFISHSSRKIELVTSNEMQKIIDSLAMTSIRQRDGVRTLEQPQAFDSFFHKHTTQRSSLPLNQWRKELVGIIRWRQHHWHCLVRGTRPTGTQGNEKQLENCRVVGCHSLIAEPGRSRLFSNVDTTVFLTSRKDTQHSGSTNSLGSGFHCLHHGAERQ